MTRIDSHGYLMIPAGTGGQQVEPPGGAPREGRFGKFVMPIEWNEKEAYGYPMDRGTKG